MQYKIYGGRYKIDNNKVWRWSDANQDWVLSSKTADEVMKSAEAQAGPNRHGRFPGVPSGIDHRHSRRGW